MAAVALEPGMSAAAFGAAAKASGDAAQTRRLLALAAIRDGMSRKSAARIGGMDRQTLCDWVHAFNDHGVDGLISDTSPGRPPKLSAARKAEIKALVEKGPDVEKDGVVRWRRSDLARMAKSRFDVTVDADTIGRLPRQLGFSPISVRPKHPGRKDGVIEDFKKNSSIG